MEISADKTELKTNSTNGILREIKVKRQKLATVTSFRTSEQLLEMMAQNQRFSQGLRKSLQFLQARSLFGEITIYLLDQSEADALLCHLYISVWL